METSASTHTHTLTTPLKQHSSGSKGSKAKQKAKLQAKAPDFTRITGEEPRSEWLVWSAEGEPPTVLKNRDSSVLLLFTSSPHRLSVHSLSKQSAKQRYRPYAAASADTSP